MDMDMKVYVYETYMKWKNMALESDRPGFESLSLHFIAERPYSASCFLFCVINKVTSSEIIGPGIKSQFQYYLSYVTLQMSPKEFCV